VHIRALSVYILIIVNTMEEAIQSRLLYQVETFPVISHYLTY
jgi:hypothetical protein